MKHLTTILSALFIFCTVHGQNFHTGAVAILNNIQSTPSSADLCVWISETNKLVQLGDTAVQTLISALKSSTYGDVAKWSSALALGEIGNPKATLTLTEVAEKNSSESQGFYLGDLSRKAVGEIQEIIKKQGKFYKKTYAVQTTITDCETGKVEVAP